MAQNNPFFGNPLDKVTDEIRAQRFELPDFSEVAATPDAAAGTSPGGSGGLLPPPEYEPLFVQAGQQYQVPINVLMALGQQESSYNPQAIGPQTKWGKAKGMMQYIDPTAEGMGIDPLDPAQAVDAAARQFQDRIQNRGYTVEEAIMAHHGGDDRAQWGPKTRQYLKDVLGKAASIREQWQPPQRPEGVTSTAIQSAEEVAKTATEEAATEGPAQGDFSASPGDEEARAQLEALRDEVRDPTEVDAFTGADMKTGDPNAPTGGTPLDLIRQGLDAANDFLQTPASEFDFLTRRPEGPSGDPSGEEKPKGGLLGDVSGSIDAATSDPGAFTGERARDEAANIDAFTGADIKTPNTTWQGWVTNLAKEVTSGALGSTGSSVEGAGLIGQQMANVEAGRQLNQAARKFDGARKALADTLEANKDQDPQTALERAQGHADRVTQAEAEFRQALVEEANRNPDKIAGWLREKGVDIGKLAQELKADPEYQGVATDLASGVGSMLTYLGPGFVTTLMTRGSTAAVRGIAGIAGASSLAGPAGAAEAYQRAKEYGLPEEEAVRISMQGIPAGVVQVAPVATILKKIPQGIRGKAISQFRHLLESFGAEFTAEGAGAVLQNLVEKSYNADKGVWDDSLYQAAIGGSSAALISLGVQLATRGKGIGPLDAGDLGREVQKNIAKTEWASTPEMEALRLMDPEAYLGNIREQVETAAGPEAILSGDLMQPEGPAPEGPIERAAQETVGEEKVAQVPGERVTVETRTGKITGTVEDYFEDGQGNFQAQVLSDDGEVYVFDQDSQAVILRNDVLGEGSDDAEDSGGDTAAGPADVPPMANVETGEAPGESDRPESSGDDQGATDDATATEQLDPGYGERASYREQILEQVESEQDVQDIIEAEMEDKAGFGTERRQFVLDAAEKRLEEVKAQEATKRQEAADALRKERPATLAEQAPEEARPRVAEIEAEVARLRKLADKQNIASAVRTTEEISDLLKEANALIEGREVEARPEPEPERTEAGEAIVTHITQRGKEKRGVLRDIPLRDAKQIDPYAFKKDGKAFINLSRLDGEQQGEPVEAEGPDTENEQAVTQDTSDKPLEFKNDGKPFASYERAQRAGRNRRLTGKPVKVDDGWAFAVDDSQVAQAEQSGKQTYGDRLARQVPSEFNGNPAVRKAWYRGYDAAQKSAEAKTPAPGNARPTLEAGSDAYQARVDDWKARLKQAGSVQEIEAIRDEIWADPERTSSSDFLLSTVATGRWQDLHEQAGPDEKPAPLRKLESEEKPTPKAKKSAPTTDAITRDNAEAQLAPARWRGDQAKTAQYANTLMERGLIEGTPQLSSARDAGDYQAMAEEIDRQLSGEAVRPATVDTVESQGSAAARQRARNDRTPPIADARREDRKRDTRKQGREAALEGDPRELPEWLQGDAELESEFLAGYGEGIAQRSQQQAEAKPQASENTIFTEDAAEKARALLKSKLGQINSGLDPEMFQAGIVLAGYHVERNARSFAAYARAMVDDLGDAVKPHLKQFYMGLKYDPRATGFEGMDSAADVDAADVDAVLAETAPDTQAEAEAAEESDYDAEMRRKSEERAAFSELAQGRDLALRGRYESLDPASTLVRWYADGANKDTAPDWLVLNSKGNTFKATEAGRKAAGRMASKEAERRRLPHAVINIMSKNEEIPQAYVVVELPKAASKDPDIAGLGFGGGSYAKEGYAAKADFLTRQESIEIPESQRPGSQPATEEAVKAAGSETTQEATEKTDLEGAQVTPEVFAELMTDAEAVEDPRSPFVTAPKITRAADAAKQNGTMSMEDAQDRVERWKAHARAQGESGVNSGKVVLSLFEVSGELTRPWVEAGYDVQTFDIQTGTDIAEFDVERLMTEVEGGMENVHAILACPPCTDFAGSGARWWAEKDAAGKTEASKDLVRQVLNTVELVRPPVWMIENPVGRMARVMGMPHPTLTFQPHNYGDPFTKKTLLWGDFNPNLPQANVDPSEGSRVHKLSGRDKDARSETPEGFARAFFMANNAADMAPADLLARQFRGMDPALFGQAIDAGLTPEQIRSLIEDDYNDVALEAAESALRDATRMQRPEHQAERQRLQERQEEVTATSRDGDARTQAWADLQFEYVEQELRDQESKAREERQDDPQGDSAAGTQPLVDTAPESHVPAEPGADPERVDGVRPSREAGDGQPESDRTRRGDGLERGEVAGAPGAADAGGSGTGDAAAGPGGGHRAPASDSLNRGEDRPHTLAGENPGNFVIPDDFKLGQGSDGAKIKDNLAALEVMLKANAENRFATPAEQKILARYVGWGGLGPVFDPKNRGASNQYGRAHAWLKENLTKEQFAAAKRSIQDSHYTSDKVVGMMWKAARHFGFKGGRALEPTVGTGNFLGLEPADLAGATEWHASELDDVSGRIAQLLYPEANVLAATGFQDAPFADGVMDLAIGNPPFGSQPIRDRSKRRAHLDGMKIHNYIIAKAGMHLRPGGVMQMVVTHRFLDTADPEGRRELAKHFRLLGAVRLPNDAFKATAGTEVTTDLVYLQKLHEGEAPDSNAAWLDTEGQIEVDGVTMRVNRYFQEHPENILGKSSMAGSMYRGQGQEYTVESDGRDIAQAFDQILAKGDLAGMVNVMQQSDIDRDGQAVMLEQSDLPVGGMTLTPEGTIIQRDLDDAAGNSVINEVTPESYWKEKAAQWGDAIDSVKAIKAAREDGRPVSPEMLKDLEEAAQVATKADGSKKPKPTKAEQALYDVMDAAANPTMAWTFDEGLAAMEATLERKQLGRKGYDTLRKLLDLRGKTLNLLYAERTDNPGMEAARKDLNQAYDAFVKAYGLISDPGNLALLAGDVGVEVGLETDYQPAIKKSEAEAMGIKPTKASASKADILQRRVTWPEKVIDHADNALDGLNISLSEKGKLDLPYIASLTGKPEGEVINELQSEEAIFYDMDVMEFVPADEYLSGNVKHKLQVAIENSQDDNVAALEKVQPEPKTQDNVTPSIRGTWLPSSLFEDFLGALGLKSPRVLVQTSIGRISAREAYGEPTELGLQFSDPDVSMVQLFNAASSGKSLKVMRKDSDGNSFEDKGASQRVTAKAERMAQVFAEWAYSEADRAQAVVDAYNRTMNTHRQRSYNGEKYLKTVGQSPSVKLRRTQKNVSWRMIQSNSVLMDHTVGAGKTMSVITGIMERRRLGLSRKPAIAVPNHLVVQWASEFYQLYPGARILAATPDDFSKKNRRRLFARIATGDYDAIIMGHSSFGFIEPPEADVRDVIAENKAKLEFAMEEAKQAGESGRSLKQMQKKLDTYDDRLRALAERERDEMGVDFGAMGIDYLAVDEAHAGKNLEYATSGERVVGMNDPKGSKWAFDLYTKVRGLQNRGGGVTFATGTPVSNSLVELYTMMRYLAPESLKARDQDHFDAWAGAYAVTETRMEYTATQKLKPRRVLSGLANLDGLGQLYREFADIITMDDLKRIYSEEKREKNARTGENERTEFPVPKVKHGGRQLDTGEITQQQSEYMDYLVARMQAIEENKRDPEYARIDNPLWVLSDARKMSLDIRVVDPTAQRDQDGKVMRSTRKIKDLYDRWDADRGTQMVFSDLSTPSKTSAGNARKIIGDGLKVVFGEAEAKRVKPRLKNMSMQEQWKYVQQAAERVMDDPAIDGEKVGKIEEFLEANAFADSAMLVADTGFSVYDDLKQVLTEMGIPSHEIAFIHDYNTPDQKSRLFARVNSGAIRVLIGSTEKMGAGTNAQERLVGMHHLDAPWRPSDVEQREGRIIRQGNKLYGRDPDNFEVEITAYSTNGTSDTVMWQVLERKAAAIEQFRQAGLDSMQEDGADSDQYAEFMATSTGNPVFKLKLEAERDLTNTQAEVGGKLIAVQNARSFMERYPERVESLTKRQADLKAMEAGDIVVGDQTGSLEGLNEVIEAAKAKFLEDYAAWEKRSAEVQKEREVAAAAGKRMPGMPSAPSEPALMDDAITKQSDYARAIKTALEQVQEGAKDQGRIVPVRIGNIDLEVERRIRGNGNVAYQVHLKFPNGTISNIAHSEAKNPVDAPTLVNALTPKRIKEMIEVEMRSVEYGQRDVESRVERESKLAKEEVSEQPITDAQTLLDWYKDQVKIAEYEADIKRGERQNRYIDADRSRPIGQFKKRGEVEAKTFTVGGETFTTTGLAAMEGGDRLTIHDATRDSDGAKALVYEQKEGQDAEPVVSAVLEPAEARKQRRSRTAQSNARKRPTRQRMSAPEVAQRLRQGRYGDAVGKLMDSGKVVVSNTTPGDVPNSTAAYVDEQGLIHLVARNLDPRYAEATLLHEAFHAGARPLIGSRRWNELQERLDKLYRQAERSSGYNRQFWEAAHVRIAAAEAAGDVMGHARRIEEFGAYAIEEFASAPRTLRKWASEVIGLVKAWLNRVFGIQAGQVTPAQLKALAAAALRNGEMAPSPALGPQTAPDTAAFKRWFGDSKAVNSAGQPKVYYHGTFSDFSEFQPSGQAGGLIFFTDQIGVAEEYARSQRSGYGEMMRVGDLSEVSTAAEAHPEMFDGLHLRADTNPADVSRMLMFEQFPYEIAKLSERIDEGTITHPEVVAAFNEIVDAIQSGGSLMPVYLKAERPYGYRTMPLHWRQAEAMGADRLRAEGYDSVWVTEGDGAALAVLDSSQIKSAIGNRGTFDPTSQDITLSVDNTPLVDRDGNPVPERERKAELGKAVRKARKALSVVQQDGVNDRDGGVVRDILKPTALLTQPYTIASMEPEFTPVFRTAMAQMRFRDTIISEMYPRFQAYKELRSDSRAKVNRVLELGRLSGLSYSDARLKAGIENRGYKTVVSYDPLGLPLRRQEPLNAALTQPGEVTKLTQEEIAAYRELRTMFDEALDLFRDQTLIDMDMAEFVGSKDPVAEILAAIDGEMSDAKKERYRNIAKMAEEIDQAKRTGYVPLARYGRFVVTVKEKIANVKYAKNPEGGFIARGVPDTLADFMRDIGATWNDLENGWQVSDGQRRQLARETTRTVYSEKLDPESYANRWETWRASKNGKRPDSLSFIKEAKARIEAEWGGEGRRVSVLDTKKARLDGGLKLSDIDSLADMAQVDPATWENIRDDFVKAMKGRGFRKHFFRADHVPGYEVDFERAIADYISGMAGYLSRRHHDKQWETAIGGVRGPNLNEYSKEYRDYVNSPAEEHATLRQVGFLYYIAGNVSTALLNWTQVPIMTMPALGQVMGSAKASKHVTGAYKDALAMTSLYDQAREGYQRGGVAGAAENMLQMFDPNDAPEDVRAEVLAAWEDGMFSPQFTHEVMGFSNRRDGSAQAKLEKTIDYVASSYTYIERLNRLVTFIAAVRAAKDPKVKGQVETNLKGNHLARATLFGDNWSPKAFGEFIVDESQFLMGKVNRATILRSHGAAIFQFMSFVINSLQAWYRWSAVNGRDGKMATAYSLAAVTALSGVWGAPGAEYLRQAIEQLWLTLTGEDEDLRYNLREWVGRKTGSDMLGEIVDKGSFYPLGADMSGRIGFMRMLPDMTDPIAMFGIPADLLIGRPSRAANAALQGNYGGAVAELAPNFLKNPITAMEWSKKGVVSRGGNQAITPEQLPQHAYWYKALGIQPSIVSDAWEYKFAKSRLQRSTSDAKSRLVNKLARAEADATRNEDPARQPELEARIERLYQDVDEFNDEHPDDWLDPRTLQRRVRNKVNEYLYGFDQMGPVPSPTVDRAMEVYNVDDMLERGRENER